MRTLWIAVTLSVGLLNGCSNDPENCDPMMDDVGFITKFNCNFSGEYDRRIANKQVELENAKALNAYFNKVYKSLEIEKSQLHKQVRLSKTEANKLKTALNSLLSQLEQKDNNQPITASENQLIKDIKNQVEDLDNDSDDDVIMLKEKDLEKLRKRVSTLQQLLGLE